MRTREQTPRNIYKNARKVAGLTQERWAEAMGVCTDTIRGYESGEVIPPDEVVKIMAEISGLTPLCYWHICNKSALAADTLPEVEQLPLPQAVIQLLCAINEFKDLHGDLLALAADGKITTNEAAAWDNIVARLDKIIRAAIQVKVAEGGGGA